MEIVKLVVREFRRGSSTYYSEMRVRLGDEVYATTITEDEMTGRYVPVRYIRAQLKEQIVQGIEHELFKDYVI